MCELMSYERSDKALMKAGQLNLSIVAVMYHVSEFEEKFKELKDIIEFIPYKDFKMLDSHFRSMLQCIDELDYIVQDMDSWCDVFECKNKMNEYERD